MARLIAAGLVFCAPMAVTGAVWAATASDQPAQLTAYDTSAQAPVVQITQDDPTASFHPQGEGELSYAESDMAPGRAHAFAAPFWPGAAAGNVGSLIGVLGYPPQPELNDPVRAEVETGTGSDTATLGAGAFTSTASVRPEAGDSQGAVAQTVTGPAAGLGSGTAKTVLSLTNDGKLTSTATTTASDVDIAGVVKIGSITSFATLSSADGGKPKGGTAMTTNDFTIAGQQAYVDGSGVHFGPPPKAGQPTNPEIAGIVDQALAASNIQLYYTAPRQVPLGGSTYEYGASLLIFWQPPHDSNQDTFTFSFGGAAVAMNAGTGTVALPVPPLPAPPTPGGTTEAAPAVAPEATGPTGPATADVTAAPPSVAPPAAPAAPAPPLRSALASAPFRTGGGVPWGWILLLGVSGLAGAVLLPFVPSLLSAAAGPACDRERPRRP